MDYYSVVENNDIMKFVGNVTRKDDPEGDNPDSERQT